MILENKFNLATFTHSDTAEKLHLDNTQMTDGQFNSLQKLHGLLVEIQSRISIKFGKPIPLQINSAFRSEAVNKAVGGVSTSDHCSGSASDTVAIGVPIRDFYDSLRELAKNKIILFGQVILEYDRRPKDEAGDWIHIALPRKGHINDFMYSIINNGKREYVKEPIQ